MATGGLLLHSPKLVSLRNDTPYEFSLGWVVQVDPTAEYAQFWGYPLLRVSYQYIRLGSDQHLGAAHALYPSLQFYPFRYRRFRLELDIASGLAIVPLAYSPTSNPYNSAVGSVFNAFLSAGFGAGFLLSDRSAVSLAGRYTHISNGTIVRPNMGLNFFLLSLAYTHLLGTLPASSKPAPTQGGFSDIHRIRINLGGGMKRVGAPLGQIIPKGMITLQYLLAPSKYLGYFAALDYAVEGNVRGQFVDSVRVYTSPWKQPYVAAYAGVELSINRFNASIGVGSFIMKPESISDRLCERVRLSFLLTQRMRMMVGIIAYSFKADFMEVGLQFDIIRWGKRKE